MPRGFSRVRTAIAIIILAGGAYLIYTQSGLRIDPTNEGGPVTIADKPINLILRDATLENIRNAAKESGKRLDDMRYLGGTLLYHAADKRRADVVRWAINQGADPNGGQGLMPPLLAAIKNSDADMVKLLVSAGADPDANGAPGVTLRKMAEATGSPAVMKALDEGAPTPPETD